MLNVKRGFIVKICKQDNVGFIVDENGTHWTFFLDEMSKVERQKLSHETYINFIRDQEFPLESFVATKVRVIHNTIDRAV